MAIRRSAAHEIQRLVADLSAPDPAGREAATARLSVIGERAVPHLIDGLAASKSAAGRAAILKVLEATRDRRSLDAAVQIIRNPATEPREALAATSLVGRFLDSERSQEPLETLIEIAVDPTASDWRRVAALDALSGMPARVLEPLRKRLASDRSPAVRARASGGETAAPFHSDPLAALDAAASGGPIDPGGLKLLLKAVESAAPIPSLHRLVESIKAREQSAPSAVDRAEWQEARGLVHFALAARGSRVALYDLRETASACSKEIPAAFLAALGLIGDKSCLEPIVGALARATGDRTVGAEWRGRLLATARAIVSREKLTRRHGVVRRVIERWPGAAADLLAKPG